MNSFLKATTAIRGTNGLFTKIVTGTDSIVHEEALARWDLKKENAKDRCEMVFGINTVNVSEALIKYNVEHGYDIPQRNVIIFAFEIVKKIVKTFMTDYDEVCGVGVHRLVADAFCDKSEGLDVVDHIDHDRSNNNAENLRWVNASANAHNRRKQSNASSKYFGVNLTKGKYLAKICIEKKHIYLGRYVDEKEAARAYDRKALEVFGQFANLNFPLKDYINY
jgi:hypothetical protein